ncbi:MAG: NUDIX hydrolase N-terminal domain-containing protein, partial [Ignavibacteria bacterium]|nr:NUDIX hydrolase N-terminal domain-containing protein [Ignavibacteria bacterium]
MKKVKSKKMNTKWLEWSQQLIALSQNGLTYAENQFERERYLNIRKIAHDMLKSLSDLDANRIKNIFEDEKGYATPKVDVRGVVFRNNKILLVKERSDGKWTLPGGWADVGDSPSEAVEREILEESGYKAKAVKLIALYDRNKHPHTPFVFH